MYFLKTTELKMHNFFFKLFFFGGEGEGSVCVCVCERDYPGGAEARLSWVWKGGAYTDWAEWNRK